MICTRSPTIVKIVKFSMLQWAGALPRMGETWNVSRILMGKSLRKWPLGRSGRRWQDNIKVDLSC
jgi:hypothetical protein